MPHNFTHFGTAVAFQRTARPAPASTPRFQQRREEIISDSLPAANIEGPRAGFCVNSVTSAVAPDGHSSMSPDSVWLPFRDAGFDDSLNTPSARQVVTVTIGAAGRPSQRNSLLGEDSKSQSEHRRDSCQSRSTGFTPADNSSSHFSSTPDDAIGGRRSSGSTAVSARWEPQAQQHQGKQQVLVSTPPKRQTQMIASGTGGSDARAVPSERKDAYMNLAASADVHHAKNDSQQLDRSLPATAGSRMDVAAGGDGTKSSNRKAWPLFDTVYRSSRGPRNEGSVGRKLPLDEEQSVSEHAERQSRNEEGREAITGAARSSVYVEEDEEARGFPGFLLSRRRRHITGGSCVLHHESTRTQVVVKPCIWIAPQFAINRRSAAIGILATERDAFAFKTQEEGGRTVQSLQSQAIGAGPVSPDVLYARSLRSPSAEDVDEIKGVEGGASDSASGAKRGFFWSKSRRHLGSAQRTPRLQRTRQMRINSHLQFYAKRLLCVVIYFVVADVFMCALSTTSDLIYQHNPQPKLRDRFHDWIVGGSPPPGLAQIVTDCLTGSLFFITILRHLLFVQVPLNIVILLRFFFVMSTVYWIRGIAIFLTTIPSSVPNCKVRPVHSARDFVENMLLASVFQLPQCTDMIISGHTLSTCLCVATWLFYNNCNKDQADLERAPFHIFVRWCFTHRRKSVQQQQQPPRCYSTSAFGDESIGPQNSQLWHLQQHVFEQYDVDDSDLYAQKRSDVNLWSEPEGALGKTPEKDVFLEQEGREQHGITLLLPQALSGHQARSSPSVRKDLDAESSSRKSHVDSASSNLHTTQHSNSLPSYQENVTSVEFADDRKVLQHETEEFTTTEEHGSTGGRYLEPREVDSEEYALTPGSASPPAALRSEAVVGAGLVVADSVAAPAPNNVVCLNAGTLEGHSTDPRTLRSAIPLGGTACAFTQERLMCGAEFACPVSFPAADAENLSPSATVGLYTACFTAAVDGGDERKSSFCSQEMEDFSRAEIIPATGSAPEDQDASSTDTECSREQEEQRIAAQDATELRGSVATSLFLIDGKELSEEEKEGRGEREVCEALSTAYRFVQSPSTRQERPLSTCDDVSLSPDEAVSSTEAHRTAGKWRDKGEIVSIFAPSSCLLNMRASVAAVANGEKAPDDCSSISQNTPGASSCSSSEEEDGMRALLAPHQSRRRHLEKEDSSPFHCCAMPPGLSSFFAAAHNVSSPSPAVEVEKQVVPAGTLVPVVAPFAADCRGEKAAGYGVNLKNEYPANQAQKREEELERMGQHIDAERTSAAGGIIEPETKAAAGSRKGGTLQSCKSILNYIRSRLKALLMWGCAWNMLGTWCILQAAANIIVIDTSFCHYTVDIFFGIFFSFGTFTFYHMIVCLLWAARSQEEGRIASPAESSDEAATRYPARRFFKCRSSRCSSGSGSREPYSARKVFARSGSGGSAELQKSSTPRRRRAPRATTGTRLEGSGASSTSLNAGDTTGRRGDLKERGDDEDRASVASQRGVAEATASSEGESNAVALSIMRELGDSASCSGVESTTAKLVSSGEEDLTVSSCATSANKLYRFAASVMTPAAVETPGAGDRVHEPSLPANAIERIKDQRLQYRNEGQHLAPLEQHVVGECIERELPAVSERHFQTLPQHLEKPPEDALITSLDEARTPRVLLWDNRKGSAEKAEESHRSADEVTSSLKTSLFMCPAGGAALGDTSRKESDPAVASVHSGGSREFQKKKKILGKENTTARGGKGRRQKVTQSIEREMQSEFDAHTAADIAISILRFPLVRCPAYFIARLEGLELP